MKISDDLFKLIKSLTKNEKGYFKKFSSAHTHSAGERNKYLELFDAIERQEEYDEQAIREKFAKERFVKQLNVAKLYLYDSVLKCMELYQKGVGLELRRYINQAEFLLEKNLVIQSNKLVQKGKQLAIKFEKHTELSLLIELEIRCLSYFAYKDKSENEISKIFNENFSALDKIKNTQQFNLLMIRLMKLFPRTKEDWNKYELIINDPLLKSEKNALSTKAAYYYFLAQVIYYDRRNDNEKSYLYSKKGLQNLEKHPEQIPGLMAFYINALKNYCTILMEGKKYKEVPEIINKLRSINSKSTIQKEALVNSAIMYELDFYINTGEFQKGVKLIQQYEHGQKANGFDKSEDIGFAYLSACIFFGLENYSKANKYLNLILNDENANTQSGIYSFAKIFSIIVCFEKGDQDLLEYIVRSTYRYLYKSNRLFKFEEIILKFIKIKVPEMTSLKKQLDAFKELKNEIEKLKKDQYENGILKYFDFISWLDSKIQKKSFAEVVRENAFGN